MGLPSGPGFDWPSDKLKSELQAGSGRVLESFEGKATVLVAFVLWRVLAPDLAEISCLATHRSRRGEGLMKRLLLETFNANGQIQEWQLEVHEVNLPARRLYELLGFQSVGLRPSYYSDGGDAVLMSRRQSP